MKNRIIASVSLLLACSFGVAQQIDWPEVKHEAKPASRWWWMGSAVDKENLSYNLREYASAGFGTMEITPIYGVQGNEINEIPYLTPKWMEMLEYTQNEAAQLGMQIDMNNGTGWPFGGPYVDVQDAASKLIISEYKLAGNERLKEKIQVSDEKEKPYAVLSRLMAFSDKGICHDLTNRVKEDGTLNWKAPKGNWRLIAAFCGKTLQKVKRSAPGGEGYVLDHLSANSVKRYLQHFEQAFAASGVKYPHNLFNDSYEVYGADWTPDFFDQFAKRRGYKLEEHLPEFLSEERTDITARIVSDYRETMGELLLENFTRQWTDWAHKHGTETRNQAHGSPANLIDIYAAVDIPECEGFGLSDFGIDGLRKDSLTRPNDSDLSILKYASSAAHIAGKPYTSSETFTWLTDHFRTSLSQCKPDIDLLFVSGVNHTYFHGTTYSPKDDPWPGWKFYATTDMSPTNSIWRDMSAFSSYITRCQSFLQSGKPDNDFLVYLPIYDLWNEQQGRLLLFDIHKMDQRAPRFMEAVHKIYNSGYDMDYISDSFIRSASCKDGKIITSGGNAYKALVVPGVKLMPEDVLAKLLSFADQGATIVFLEQYPEDVPGYGSLESRRSEFKSLKNVLEKKTGDDTKVILGQDYSATLARTQVVPEILKRDFGLSYIRRVNNEGYHYFISALKPGETNAWIPLSVQAKSAILYDPMTGRSGKARTRNNGGKTEVFLQLASGESVILKTFTTADVQVSAWKYWAPVQGGFELSEFDFSFAEGEPSIQGSYRMDRLTSWTNLPVSEAKAFMGTGVYSYTFVFNGEKATGEDWLLNVGDVRESARVRVNGTEVGTLWAVPFRCFIGDYIKPGENKIEIEVTNLPANRISEMDRQHIPWRKYKDINIVDLNYKKAGYAHWEPMESGLLGPVKIQIMKPLFP